MKDYDNQVLHKFGETSLLDGKVRIATDVFVQRIESIALEKKFNISTPLRDSFLTDSVGYVDNLRLEKDPNDPQKATLIGDVHLNATVSDTIEYGKDFSIRSRIGIRRDPKTTDVLPVCSLLDFSIAPPFPKKGQ